MSTILTGDAAFRYVSGGQEYWHHLSHPLHKVTPSHPETVYQHQSVDLGTFRRVRIASTVEDVKAIIRRDGQGDSFARFLKEARAGATLEYFPSLSNASESYTCVLVSASEIQPDSDMWWQHRFGTQVHLRRIDGGSWAGLTSGLLFMYRAGNDLPGLTFTRSGAVGSYVDSDGVIQSAAANEFRTTFVDSAPHLLLEPARTNLVTSDDVTAWTDANTTTVTGSIADPAGGTGAYNIAGDGGAVSEGRYRSITFTGDGLKSVSFVVKEHTMPASGNQRLRVWDQTAGVTRLDLDISAWSGGEPTVAAGTGTYLGKRYIGNGFWAIYGQTTTVTAANAHRVYAYSNVDASAGTITLFRANAVDSPVPSFSILNASEARNADLWYADFTSTPEAIAATGGTIYCKWIERGGYDIGATNFLVHVGGGDPRWTLAWTASGNLEGGHNNGSSLVTSTLSSGLPTWGDTVEAIVQFYTDGSVQTHMSVNGGAVASATASAAHTPSTSGWANERVYMNSNASGNQGVQTYREVKIIAGVKTLAEMRAV